MDKAQEFEKRCNALEKQLATLEKKMDQHESRMPVVESKEMNRSQKRAFKRWKAKQNKYVSQYKQLEIELLHLNQECQEFINKEVKEHGEINSHI